MRFVSAALLQGALIHVHTAFQSVVCSEPRLGTFGEIAKRLVHALYLIVGELELGARGLQ
jgi:hypothetical protein